MIVLLPLIGLLAWQAPAPLHCRIEVAAGADSKRCQVSAPKARHVRRCTPADEQAGHCGDTGGERYVAWVVASGPGRCRITDKKTTWKRGVVSAKLSPGPGGGGPSTCDLYVEVE
ncbi:MAG TPA: hypothetical protein VEK77_07655 [Gemmatimonadales bacterium]|nr:hypothetical protein [Gemmatimonadales bacterium]